MMLEQMTAKDLNIAKIQDRKQQRDKNVRD